MMVKRIGVIENIKDDEELEMLLGEIPHATSLTHHHHHHHPSHANGHHHHHHVVNGNCNGSIETQTMNRMIYGMYDEDTSCSYKQNTCISPASAFSLQSDGSYSSLFSNGRHSLSDNGSPTPLPFYDPIPKPHMYSRNPLSKLPDYSYLDEKVDEKLIEELDMSCKLSKMYIGDDQDEVLVPTNNLGMNRINFTRTGAFDINGKSLSDYTVLQPPVYRNSMDFNGEMSPALFGFQQNYGLFQMQIPHVQSGIGLMDDRGLGVQPVMHNVSHFTHPGPHTRSSRGHLDDSLIIQGESLSNVRNRGIGGQRGQIKKCFVGAYGNGRVERVQRSFPSPVRFNSLAEAQGNIYLMAKDQNGCRFLQKIFDEGSPKDVQIVFNEIIGHVIELMVNNFGNYLMQKLLEVCNEEQRMRILMAVTHKPRELVQISLDSHGTRVVQKLVETLKTKQQIKLVISALEPGFLALINDLNGNHVIQRCLQCLSIEDNKFIFEAAAKFCVDIATHQHGCCVLQRCINHSTGEHRDKLVSEVSSNGLLLAQNEFGNYVVQYILDLQIPFAISKMISQFQGNFVTLSAQKYSSHVVEKSLSVLNGEVKSMIIHELLSAPRFDQLLQDPHANYVVQTALRVAEGPLHNLLVNAIVSHKAISRNSPYSKKIFSHKLLKR